MYIAHNHKELKIKLKEAKQGKVAFVPTMGALHEGHLSLIEEAKRVADSVVVSIFVNPAQFNDQEDFAKYPNQIEQDKQMLQDLGVDILFLPSKADIYPDDFYTEVNIKTLGDKLCGKARQGHFAGVCLVVTKLFNMVQPDIALFGLKDYQQFLIIKQLAKDLNFPIEIKGCAIKREESGLAMSSRNLRLTKDQFENIAPKLYKILQDIAIKLKEGLEKSEVVEQAKTSLKDAGFGQIDYLEVLQSNLAEYQGDVNDGRIFVAVFLGEVRLIDNIKIC